MRIKKNVVIFKIHLSTNLINIYIVDVDFLPLLFSFIYNKYATILIKLVFYQLIISAQTRDTSVGDKLSPTHSDLEILKDS